MLAFLSNDEYSCSCRVPFSILRGLLQLLVTDFLKTKKKDNFLGLYDNVLIYEGWGQ